MKPLLAIRGLAKSYGAVAALRGVDLDVGEREFLVVLGATGSGKTTLLRSIAGLLAPDAGTIELGGRAANALSPAERDIAYVFQNFSLYPSMTVRENLAFPLRAPGRRLEPAVVDERVARAAGLLRIERLLERPARRLSGGEMQRVAIGRAIVREPRLFLMDEPLSNLDAKLRLEMRHEIRRICRELGITTVYVTHDQDEALSLADHVVVMRDGRIIQQGSPRDLYERPETRFLAEFLGETNFIPATVERLADGRASLRTLVGTLQSDHLGDRAVGSQVLLSVRTEAWSIDPAGPVALPCTQSTYLGKLAQHELDASGLCLRVTELNPPVADRSGQTLRLSVDPAKVIILDGE